MNIVATTLSRKEIITDKKTIALIGIISFVLFTALGAYVYVPLAFTPVPLTMQTFFVLLSGALLGKRLGSLSQAVYILLGMGGIPLFSAGSFGLMRIAGPTGGYLFGFVLAGYAVGKMLKNKDSLSSIAIALTIGALIILLSGAGWLCLGLGFSIKNAFLLGVVPFMPGEILKVAAAAIICRKYLKRAKEVYSL